MILMTEIVTVVIIDDSKNDEDNDNDEEKVEEETYADDDGNSDADNDIDDYGNCVSFAVAVFLTRHHGQGHLKKKEFALAYSFRGIRVHHGKEAW